MHTISIFCGLQKLNTLNLRHSHPPLNPRNHFSTVYPVNYQIIIDSSLGNYAVLRDFFSALHEGHGRPRSVRKSSRLRGKCLSMDCICPLACCCSDRRKSVGPSAPIAYATSVSPPDEAAIWPGAQFLQITVHTNSTFPSS